MIKLNNITKIYDENGAKVEAIKNLSLNVKEGEMVAVMGPSGSGKSTLLNIIGCMDVPTEGIVAINAEEINYKRINEVHDIRKKYISFIFQHFALMEKYTVFENVEMPLIAREIKGKIRKRIVEEKLSCMGISDLAKKYPSNISGGQRQRVAIARALASDTPIILADEPTGALDQKNGKEVINILKKLNDDGKTVLLITHDVNIANQCKRKIELVDGEIISDISV